MFSSVLGLFSQDLALDLGSSNTRIAQRGQGVVVDEPTVVAVHTDDRGRRRVLTVGAEARRMLGRTPAGLEAVQPVRGGRILDYEVTEALLYHLVRRVHGRRTWVSPRVAIAVPHTATEMERRAVRESCEAAGAREVHLVPRPLATALGAELPVEEAAGHMIVDLGGGTAEISVLSMGGVVSSHLVEGGGEQLDRAVRRHLEKHHSLLVGAMTAEALKIDVGFRDDDGSREVRGRCLVRGIPRAIEVRSPEIRAALREPVAHLAAAIRHVLERTAPELASDIVLNGVVLAGAGARLARLDDTLRDATGLPVVVADRADTCTVRGVGHLLERSALLEKVAS